MHNQPQIKWSNECSAPVITSRPDSAMSVLKWMRFPVCHIWISSVCPGMVGFVKRALTALNSDTSLSAYANKTARTEKPNVHRPCKIGTLWPAIFEKSGSMCNGFKSPDNLKTEFQDTHFIILSPKRFPLSSRSLTGRVLLDHRLFHTWWINRMDDLELVRPGRPHPMLSSYHQNYRPQQWMLIFDFSTATFRFYHTIDLI